MGVPRGTRAPLNPLCSACNDCVSQDFTQQKVPSCCCGSVQGTCSTLQGKDWGRAHENKSRIIVLKRLKLGTRGRIWCSFSKKKKGHTSVFSSVSAKPWPPGSRWSSLKWWQRSQWLWGGETGQTSDGPKTLISFWASSRGLCKFQKHTGGQS